MIRRELWDAFQVCVSSPKLTSNCSGRRSPLIASQNAEPDCTKKSDLSKQNNQYLLRENRCSRVQPSFFHVKPPSVVSRCNNQKVPRLTARAACHADLMCLGKELFGRFTFNSPDTMVHLTSNSRRKKPKVVLPRTFLEGKRLHGKIRWRINESFHNTHC